MLVIARSAFIVVAMLAIAIVKRIITLVLIVRGTKEGVRP
jgi:hypothetical protein